MRTSRFITSDDLRIDKVMLELPKHWWSRPYEYAWAASFAAREHTVLDAACGLCHPFKYYLCNICKYVYACDKNEHILCNRNILLDMFRYFGVDAFDFPLDYLGKPILSRQDISKTSYDDAMFNTIFCISVLEHLPEEEVLKILVEFKR
ncbi:MAG: class I SAM-dependent methyltransferase, partial [Syntrophomonas sp.]